MFMTPYIDIHTHDGTDEENVTKVVCLSFREAMCIKFDVPMVVGQIVEIR